jgi:hypothetical protein
LWRITAIRSLPDRKHVLGGYGEFKFEMWEKGGSCVLNQNDVIDEDSFGKVRNPHRPQRC